MPEDRNAVSKRLERTYGITLAEYEQRLADQGGVCAICKKPPGKNRLSVDHDHVYDRVKIVVQKLNNIWIAVAKVFGKDFTSGGPVRKLVKESVRRLLRRQSVRGLCCWSCNKGLQYYRDNPEFLRNAADYLERFKNASSPAV